LKIIVIKDIPVTIEKRQLAQQMTNIGLPRPIKFNYNFYNDCFTGVAFADFASEHDAAKFRDGINRTVLDRQQLKAEYKRILPDTELNYKKQEKRERQEQDKSGPMADELGEHRYFYSC
jgi:hypothetical protein